MGIEGSESLQPGNRRKTYGLKAVIHFINDVNPLTFLSKCYESTCV